MPNYQLVNIALCRDFPSVKKIGWRYLEPALNRFDLVSIKQTPPKGTKPNKMIWIVFKFHTTLKGDLLEKRKLQIFNQLERVAPLP